jgi:AraC-like DNA-binding protein
MVSSRDIHLVRALIAQAGLQEAEMTSMGKAVVEHQDPKDLERLRKLLEETGLGVAMDPADQIVERIKVAAIELFYHGNNANSLIRNSDHLSERTGVPYHQLSRTFSDRTGTTLERYIILLKVERVKELMTYGDLTLSEISYQMGYSSVQYLSNQFKQVTGVTPSEFKEGKGGQRIALDELLTRADNRPLT